jgi:hypothetical protein
MGKEGIEKKPIHKRDNDNEYPKWPWVDYKFQDAKFFKMSRNYQLKGSILKGRLLMCM